MITEVDDGIVELNDLQVHGVGIESLPRKHELVSNIIEQTDLMERLFNSTSSYYDFM
jgi:hypothetical protein